MHWPAPCVPATLSSSPGYPFSHTAPWGSLQSLPLALSLDTFLARLCWAEVQESSFHVTTPCLFPGMEGRSIHPSFHPSTHPSFNPFQMQEQAPCRKNALFVTPGIRSLPFLCGGWHLHGPCPAEISHSCSLKLKVTSRKQP